MASSFDDEVRAAIRGFKVERDVRSDAGPLYRRNFIMGWNHALADREYRAESLRDLTWQNTGWRFGKKYGASGDAAATYEAAARVQQKR